MKRTFLQFTVFYLVVLCIPAFAQQSFSLSDPLPFDSAVIKGRLGNGLSYFIRKNNKPEKRAFLRLAVKAGSILEEDNQQGLAHVTEHMAFNGTKNFKKQEIVDYLESIGMEFGPEINAYTSFDETVYMIEVPTDNAKPLKKGVEILREWAGNLSFDPAEIDKERGVVIEEWRLGRGAAARVNDKILPVLLKGSKYASRLPIGTKEILQKFSHKNLKSFYQDWYRPDLMAVIAVGDFDPRLVEAYIKKTFSALKSPKNPRERIYPGVPDHDSTLIAVATDPELTQSYVAVYQKLQPQPQGSVADYRRYIMEDLFNGMFNERLDEISHLADPPFLFGYSAKGGFIKSKDFFMVSASVQDDRITSGLGALLAEVERVRRFGFNASELKRQKESYLRAMESALAEKDKTESDKYVQELQNHFLTDEPVPGIEFEYALVKQVLGSITLAEVNALLELWIGGKNRVVTVSMPQKDSLPVPTQAELAAVLHNVQQQQIEQYVDKTSDEELIKQAPAPGKVLAEKKIPEMDAVEWQLSNGARVILKPTTFKNDEILMQAFSMGGTSLAPDSLFIPAVSATQIVQQSGIGPYDYTTLQKFLSDKIISVTPFVAEVSEGINAFASPLDFESMLKLVYLHFTAPRVDSGAFLSYRTKMLSFINNRNLSPEAAFQDTITALLFNNHPRRKPWDEETIAQMDLLRSVEFFRSRFADASGFTFVFVGSFSPDSIKPLVETWLGGLPSLNQRESFRDVGLRVLTGNAERVVKKGMEKKSFLALTLNGGFDYSVDNNFELGVVASVLDIKLREVLRENKSGTYNIQVQSNGEKYPAPRYFFSVSFGADPARVEELYQALLQVLDSVKAFPVDDSYITKVRENLLREVETSKKENKYWVGTLKRYLYYDIDFKEYLNLEKRIAAVSKEMVLNAAKKYLQYNNRLKVVLLPEGSK